MYNNGSGQGHWSETHRANINNSVLEDILKWNQVLEAKPEACNTMFPWLSPLWYSMTNPSCHIFIMRDGGPTQRWRHSLQMGRLALRAICCIIQGHDTIWWLRHQHWVTLGMKAKTFQRTLPITLIPTSQQMLCSFWVASWILTTYSISVDLLHCRTLWLAQ